MRSKRMSLSDAKLYLILDRQVNTYDELFEIARNTIPEGVDIIQLRDKDGNAKDILHFASRIKKLTKNKIPFIINDRIDLAQLGEASGVHLGQDDIPLATARRMMGPKAIIGVSCQSASHVRKAVEGGADYIGFGSVFKTQTKPERDPMDLKKLKTILRNKTIPVFAIGGISLKNISKLRSLGVERVAVCRSICKAKDIKKVTAQFKQKLHDASN